MKLILQSTEMPEESWKAFAEEEGWLETELLTGATERTPNKQTFMEYIVEKNITPIWNRVSNFQVREALQVRNAIVEQADADLESARATAMETAKQIVTLTIE